MKLFIIGNGFDLAHSMPTTFEDFHKYLREQYNSFSAKSGKFNVPEIVMGHHEEVQSETEIIQLLEDLINEASETYGDDWNNFEKTLGHLDFLPCFDNLCKMYDDEGDRDIGLEIENAETMCSNLHMAMEGVVGLIRRWIYEVNDAFEEMTPKIDESFSKLICPEDLFLSFNYTHTLEVLYKCKNICHIHGDIHSDIVIGHAETSNDDYSDDYPSIEELASKVHQSLRKNTHEAITAHQV